MLTSRNISIVDLRQTNHVERSHLDCRTLVPSHAALDSGTASRAGSVSVYKGRLFFLVSRPLSFSKIYWAHQTQLSLSTLPDQDRSSDGSDPIVDGSTALVDGTRRPSERAPARYLLLPRSTNQHPPVSSHLSCRPSASCRRSIRGTDARRAQVHVL